MDGLGDGKYARINTIGDANLQHPLDEVTAGMKELLPLHVERHASNNSPAAQRSHGANCEAGKVTAEELTFCDPSSEREQVYGPITLWLLSCFGWILVKKAPRPPIQGLEQPTRNWSLDVSLDCTSNASLGSTCSTPRHLQHTWSQGSIDENALAQTRERQLRFRVLDLESQLRESCVKLQAKEDALQTALAEKKISDTRATVLLKDLAHTTQGLNAKLCRAELDKEMATAHQAALQEELSHVLNQVASTEALMEEIELCRDLAEAKFFEQGIELGEVARDLNAKLLRAVHDKDMAMARSSSYREELSKMEDQLTIAKQQNIELELKNDLAEAKLYALTNQQESFERVLCAGGSEAKLFALTDEQESFENLTDAGHYEANLLALTYKQNSFEKLTFAGRHEAKVLALTNEQERLEKLTSAGDHFQGAEDTHGEDLKNTLDNARNFSGAPEFDYEFDPFATGACGGGVCSMSAAGKVSMSEDDSPPKVLRRCRARTQL